MGKTALLTELDPSLFEIINADSIQVYRGLDIGSAKASPAVRRRIPHHLVDVEDPWNQFTVARFIELADEAVVSIASRGKIPVLCGGTAYYFKQFIYGLSDAPASDPAIREAVRRETEEKGLGWAWRELGIVDPESQKRINPADAYRVTRALEVWRESGRPLSAFRPSDTPRYGMHPLLFGMVRPADELARRIACRVDQLFRDGLVDEMRSLLAAGARKDWPGMQGIGYREFFQAMEDGDASLATIRDAIVRDSRLYAKRQLTFFRSFADVTWLASPDSWRNWPRRLALRFGSDAS